MVIVREVLLSYNYASVLADNKAEKETFCHENKKSITISTSGHCGDYQAGLYAERIGIALDAFKERYDSLAQKFMERAKKE